MSAWPAPARSVAAPAAGAARSTAATAASMEKVDSPEPGQAMKWAGARRNDGGRGATGAESSRRPGPGPGGPRCGGPARGADELEPRRDAGRAREAEEVDAGEVGQLGD